MARRFIALFTATLAIIAAPAGSASADVVHDFDFGGTGSQKGQFLRPSSVAVNDTTGDVYVADPGNKRIQRFDADGNFTSMWGLNVDATDPSSGFEVCTAASGHDCQAGSAGTTAGAGVGDAVAVDDSGGPADGSVYVLGGVRVQRFTADGQFVLMWGRQVNLTTGGNVCPVAPGDLCTGGLPGGSNATTPPTPTQPGEFGGVGGAGYPHSISVDDDGFVYVTDENAVTPGSGGSGGRIQKFDANGGFVAQNKGGGILRPGAVAVSPDGGTIWVNGRQTFGEETIRRYGQSDFTASGFDATVDLTLQALGIPAVDPSNQYLFVVGAAGDCIEGESGYAVFEYHPDGERLDCTVGFEGPGIEGARAMTSYAISLDHKMYVPDGPDNRIRVYTAPKVEKPVIGDQRATEITAEKAAIRTEIAPRLGVTTFHIEYGTSPCSTDPCESTAESAPIGATLDPKQTREDIVGLQPDTKYFFRVIATNQAGTTHGPDRSFISFPSTEFDPGCSNTLARQQTGAAFLLDCRAYELVSAEDQGGYNVTSDLVPGQAPFPGFPEADDRALYSVHNGGIPGTGKPTNRGPDPYLAIRNADNQRWRTEYVGIPADAPSLEPFSSTLVAADASLGVFAFGGAEICDPCFADGSSGVPVRRSDGALVQGMVGSPPVLDPVPAGEVRKSLSADGSTLIFGSRQRFASGGNNNGTDASIYKRNLATGATRAVSVTPGATPIQSGEGVAALDVSADGSRVLVGELVATDPEGNRHWRLYMHVGGAATSIDLTPGTTSGALYAGMNTAGTRVYFTTPDPLVTAVDQDTDTSTDLFRADVTASAASLTRVSSGAGAGNGDLCDPGANSARERWNSVDAVPSCDAVAIGGGGGVASNSGAIYFLSPEVLDTSGSEHPIQDSPNLYLARPGSPLRFVATLESSDNEPLKPVAHLFERSFGSFSYPEGVAIDRSTGSIYVYDTIAGSGADNDDEDSEPNYTPGAFVQKFDASGTPDVTFGVNSKLSSAPPTGPFLGRGSGIAGSPTGMPAQLAVNQTTGNIYVPDFGNGVINRYGPSGNYVTQFSPKIGGFISDSPSGVAVQAATGNVYVTGVASNRVYVFNANGTAIAPPPFEVTGTPLGIAVDAGGNSYVVNGVDTRVYNSTGAFVKVFSPDPSYGISIDPVDGHVYIDHGDRVVEYDAGGSALETLGQGLLDDSVGVFADAGRVAASNPGRSRAVSYTAPRVPPGSGYDNPLVLDALSDAEVRRTADFQTTPSGNHAAFATALPLTGVDSAGHYHVFRYDDFTRTLDCLSCNPTTLPAETDASLPSAGLGITDDGRVFFNTGEPLVLRDANNRRDAYEWREAAAGGGKAELISTGESAFDSGLLSVSADGTDAFFFTRETLVKNDGNGNLMKLYTAREQGGFFIVPPPPPCAASDECHGPSSPVAPAVVLGTLQGSKGNVTTRCKKGSVKRRGKCVKKKNRPRAAKQRSKRDKHRGGRRG